MYYSIKICIALLCVIHDVYGMITYPMIRKFGGKDNHPAYDAIRNRKLSQGLFKEVTFTKRENDGVYWTDIRIGTPQKTFSVIVDTGSSTIAIPCKGCSCGSQHHYFDINASSTSVISRANGYRQCYSEGSCNKGDQVKDLICVGENCPPEESIQHVFGCCKTFAGAFQKQEADGIIGVSLNSQTLVSDLQAHHRLEKNVFSLCFGSSKGSISIGGYPESRHLEPIQWAPMPRTYGEFYSLNLKSINVDGAALSFSKLSPIVDSGTTFTYVPRSIHSQLRDKFKTFCALENNCLGELNPRGTSAQDLRDSVVCYSYNEEQVNDFDAWLESFPPIEFEFEGASICIPSSSYFFKSSKNVFCVGMFPDSKFIIGAINMSEFDVIFDHDAKKIGFARANCDGEIDDPSSKVSCCGTCAEHQSVVTEKLKPHVENHEKLFTATKLNNGRLKLVPKQDSGYELDDFELKDGDDLVFEEEGATFRLCTKMICLFDTGSSIIVQPNVILEIPSHLSLDNLKIKKGATVKIIPSTEYKEEYTLVKQPIVLNGTLIVDEDSKFTAQGLTLEDDESLLVIERGSIARCHEPLSLRKGTLKLYEDFHAKIIVQPSSHFIVNPKKDGFGISVSGLTVFGEMTLQYDGDKVGTIETQGAVDLLAAKIVLQNVPEGEPFTTNVKEKQSKPVLISKNMDIKFPVASDFVAFDNEAFSCGNAALKPNGKSLEFIIPGSDCFKSCVAKKEDRAKPTAECIAEVDKTPEEVAPPDQEFSTEQPGDILNFVYDLPDETLKIAFAAIGFVGFFVVAFCAWKCCFSDRNQAKRARYQKI